MDDLSYLVTPHTLTVLCTYQCTAACKQCCFESSPDVKGRLSGDTIRARISEARSEFPSLRLVVFSGGEAFLLKQDLYDAVAHATSLGLMTRIVSNGSWAKTPASASRAVAKLKSAGLTELNLSTGKDHQEWVPAESIINAAEAAVGAGISTLVTVELDEQDGACFRSLSADQRVKRLLATKRLSLQSNSWMPFHEDAPARVNAIQRDDLRQGCTQVFGNVVVTPHDNLSACCGLTLEHIPEMRLGRNTGRNMGDLYRQQVGDFLKIWIHVDGPYTIAERVLGEEGSAAMKDVVHICQACVLMHKSERIREAIAERYQEFVPEVMTRFLIRREMEARELRSVAPVTNH